MDSVKAQQLLIGVFSVLLIVALLIVAAVEMQKTRRFEPEIEISAVTSKCITCHEKQGVAPGVIAQWKASRHAVTGTGCYECHEAKEGDFDYFLCPESDLPVARHPTPKDCAKCHETQVEEFARSKHAVAQVMMALKGADRNLFEPTLATKHGCEQCHNIGNYWPDQSVGECDACHSKHRFSLVQARKPETCGECHIGPDHPHIEIYLESKHGNLYTAHGGTWNWNYPSGDPVPFEAPTCATCHMSATRTSGKATHNVSERLAWESQAPLSVRTQPFWGGKTWEQKREAMAGVCYQCHARSFADRYLLVADLVNLQYNEIWKATVKWAGILKENGLIKTDVFTFAERNLNPWPVTGYDQEIEHVVYRNWHHEGRRFRHGAEMMGADYTQWHGIWELQENLIKIIEYGAEHGLAEAKQWMESKDPNKFMLYPLYDIPGSTWGPSALAYRGNMPMDRIPGYWEMVRENVKRAYEKGLLSRKQWELYERIYKDREKELGRACALPKVHEKYLENLSVDLKKLPAEQKVELLPPPKQK